MHVYVCVFILFSTALSIYHSLQPTLYSHWVLNILTTILLLDLACYPLLATLCTLIIFKGQCCSCLLPKVGLDTSFKPHRSPHLNPSFHVLPLMWLYASLHFCFSAASSWTAGPHLPSFCFPSLLPVFSFSE